MLVPLSIPPPPHRHRRTRRLMVALSVVGLGLLLPSPFSLLPAAFAKGIDTPLRIPLEDLGFQPLSAQLLLNGSSMLTLHYVDDKHLLLTFVVHRLIPRLPNEPADDQDRLVDALLLELPTGKVLARTTWHLHDHAQYLWSLGHGHFLLRIRDNLTTFAPLANLATPHPFAEHPFLNSSDRRFAALILSPDADLLIAETIKRTPPEPQPKTPLFGPTPPRTPRFEERDPVEIDFYRIHSGNDGGAVQVVFAGAVKSPTAGDIPVSTAGYIAVVDQGNSHWAFDFHSYAGKIAELSPYDSVCHPMPLFVSHSEFIAFGCRNSQTIQEVGGFNMRGEEMWEQGLFGDYIAPSLAYAPAVGRFALSRVLLRTTAVADQPISPDEVTTQTVVVYQTGTGKQLLHADCSPVERAGQNFALSPNGLALAVLHADAIEIYALPALTSKDESDIKLARSLDPPENNLPVHFSDPSLNSSTAAANPTTPQPTLQSAVPVAVTQPEPPPASVSQPTQSNQSAAPASEAAKPPLDTPASATQSGDPAPEKHRAPPTLYTLPTDKTPAAQQNPKQTPQ